MKIVILGAGISGLATAWWLHRDGFDVTVLEAQSQPGGSMETRRENGFLIDYGPNSGLETTPLIGCLVADVGLESEMIYANAQSSKRYILRENRLHALPMSPGAFLKTRLFSPAAKLRLLAEPFVNKSADGYYQSISEFVRRRLGQEFLDYAINPFVAGVFAGDPDKLSVQSAFPKLFRLEAVYGGLVKGMILGARERKKRAEISKQSARLFSFRNGMQALPAAIAAKLGDRVRTGCKVEKTLSADGGYRVRYRRGDQLHEFRADIVISALPAYQAAPVLDDPAGELYAHLNAIDYPPVKVLYLGFRRSAVGQALDGFGFLIPAKEKKLFLGGIWSSTLFPERARPGQAAFTLFVGGARSPELLATPDERLNQRVIDEFKAIMAIPGAENPLFVRERLWPRAIPQYTLGYIEHERCFAGFEAQHPGLFLSGNYRGGISVGDCIINSDITCQKVKAFADRSS